MRNLHAIALTLCLAAAPLAHADDATRRAKAIEMLQITQTDSIMKQQMVALQARVSELAKQEASAPGQTPAQTELSNTYLKQMSDITASEVGWDKLEPALIDSYATTFTEAELDSIIAFYKSPAGKAMIDRTPALAQKTMTMVQDRIKEMQPKLANLTNDYAAKMKAAAPAPAAATPAPKATAPAVTPKK